MLLWTGAVTFALTTTAHAAMTISSAKTRNVSCASGVCAPTGGNANLNVGDLQTMLASSDVTVKSNKATPDIGILDPLTWVSTYRLTLDAYESIHVRAPVVVEGTAGVTLTINDGGYHGDYIFNAATSGAITFWDTASSLVINGQSFTLVKDIKTLAAAISANAAGNYALANSYDASPDGTYGETPIPWEFQGMFEGLGNTISNLTIVASEHSPLNVALFSMTSGLLRDLNLTNAFVSDMGENGSISTLAGLNSGRIEWVSASGKVVGAQHSNYLGGLVGANGSGSSGRSPGTISYARSTVSVEGTATVAGGIVGFNSGRIWLSQASGGVHGLYFAGGLVGVNYEGLISQSFASGSVHGDGTGADAGGLVGLVQYGTSGANLLKQCYATGKVFSSRDGGLIGEEQGGTFSQCYATGHVADRTVSGGFVGGVENGQPDITAGYWDATTTRQMEGTGSGNTAGLTGLTDAQLKSALPAGFDPNVWGQSASINNGWPYLLANPPQQ